MDYNTLEKLGKAVLYGNILASIHTPAQTKVQFDTALEMYKKYVGNVYDNTLPAPADVGAVEGDRCLLNVNNDYEAYEVVDGVWKKYTTKEGATTEADLTNYYTKPEVRAYIDDLIKDFISKNGDNTLSGSNTFTKPIVGDLSGNADTATKATKDSEGNVIKDTYATKTECESKASLDATQMLAVNSGITASKVAEYEAMKTSKVNEADIKPVAKTGSYSDLLNKPTINDSTINIKVNGVSIGSFTTNSANAKDIAITIPTKMSDLDNDSDYVASTTLHDYAKLTEVENKISDLVNSAPETLDTLNELASALGNDPNFATTVANQIGTKANDSEVVHKSGDIITGNLLGNGNNNLGTSTNKWKTINGINPGALSLPSTGTGYVDIKATVGKYLKDNDTNIYEFTAPFDGWICVGVVRGSLRLDNLTTEISNGSEYISYWHSYSIPINRNDLISIKINKMDATDDYVNNIMWKAYICPCQGNV